MGQALGGPGFTYLFIYEQLIHANLDTRFTQYVNRLITYNYFKVFKLFDI